MSDAIMLQQLTLFAEDSPVRICPLPESGRAWLESEADFGSSSVELLRSLAPSGLLSKTSLAFYPRTEEPTSPPSFAGWSNSGMASPGGFLTLSISEWPSAAAVCSLSAVLETDAPPKYFLSPKACSGILRRAEKRGKALPERLEAALRAVAVTVSQAEPIG
jgi:hypothetical protein